MKPILPLLSVVAAFCAGEAHACRPMIHSIQHRLAIAALDAVQDTAAGYTVLELKSSALSDFAMKYVRPHDGFNCPDQYSARLTLVYERQGVSRGFDVAVVIGAEATDPVITPH